MKENKELYKEHGFSEEELKTFSSIIATDVLSVAEYDAAGKKKMSAFSHSHQDYEFIIPLETIPLLRYQNAVYIGEVGYCYPVNPFVKHGLETELNSHLFSVVIDNGYMEKIKEENGHKGEFFITRFLIDKDLLNLLTEFKITKDKSLEQEIVKNLVVSGLSGKTDTRKPANEYVLNMKKSVTYMLENFNRQNLTVKEISERSEYSYTYFTKAFFKYMNETPINYLNRLRLSQAKRLIKETDFSLSEIAKQSGFKSPSALCESFKRIVGCSPKEYRKKYL